MKKYLIFGVVAVLSLAIIGNYYGHSVSAQTDVPPPTDQPTDSSNPPPSAPNDLSGWAWSSNIGWISFNSTDAGTGNNGVGTSPNPYVVTVDPSTGAMDGYAWSSNIGWISFKPGDLSGCPNNAQPAVESTGAVTGGIRALAGAGRNDGWDGCIELSGTNHESPDPSNPQGPSLKGVFMDKSGHFSGLAWGGPVVGWVSFNVGTKSVVCSGCTTDQAPTITASCSADKTSLPAGGGAVVFTATVSGNGTSPYTFYWNGIAEGATTGNTNTQSFTYTSSGGGPILTVRDSQGYSAPAVACPNITVQQTVSPGNGISLYMGTKSGYALQNHSTTIKIHAGTNFGMAWTALPDPSTGYTCNPVPATPSAGATENWNTWTLNGSTVDGLQTTGLDIGSYPFQIACTSSKTPPDPEIDSNAATLKIISASENPI
jgi:hypothetical protein